MNPGKKVDAYPTDSNLKLGVAYRPAEPKTHFKFVEDKGSFSLASLRCVGVGECRRTEGGVMCPSFMATREEKHSTRGRSRMLFEMLTGDVVQHGWKSEAVKESLDLCLSCKGCKKECPVNVDMSTYKAEFLSHYYEGRSRPRTAYTMGLIDQWARIGSKMPGLVNFFTQTPLLRSFAKQVAGIAPERKIPRFASRTFKDRFFARGPREGGGRPQVILWADTFNNHFHPDTAMAAAETLEAAGFEVMVPRQHLCCGRPLYDYGMLTLAKSYLRKVLRTLGPAIERGVPVVGLEPSCMAVFKDELTGLFAGNRQAERLASQCYMLGDFLKKKAPHFQLPQLDRKVLIQPHCHDKSVLGFGADEELLKRMGMDVETLNEGCCGMAGSFGFDAEGGRYELSRKIGERAILPRVREQARGTIVAANGFSCREQIRAGASREERSNEHSTDF
jgi:Fe-S oxidoreductase